jgi:uroporphyrinogen III methyltransferase/synthase
VPLVLPAVAIGPPADWSAVDQTLAQLESYAWIVFTSANGVRAFLERLRHCGRDLRALGPVKLAAIGPKTADALREFHLEPDLVPLRFQSEDLAAALKDKVRPGQRVLLARADRGRELLREELAKVCDVQQLAVYSQVDAIDPASRVMDNLRRGEIDYITLTSSNIARSLIEQLDAPCRARLKSGEVGLVSISAVTSQDVQRLGFPVAAEATEATAEGVVQALIKLVRSKKAASQG